MSSIISIMNYWCIHMSMKIITFCTCTLCRWKASYLVNLRPLDSSSIDGPVVQPISSGKWLWKLFAIRYFSNLYISSWNTNVSTFTCLTGQNYFVLFLVHHFTMRDKRVIWYEADVHFFFLLIHQVMLIFWCFFFSFF